MLLDTLEVECLYQTSPVKVNATISDVLKMGVLEGIWQNKVTFEVTWVDPRLELQNLKHNDNLNILAREERDSVWFPNIIFGNTDAVERMVMDDNATLIVRREGSGTPSSVKNEIKSEIFKGEENPFFYSRTYSIKFECDFQLQSYPFDTQECSMELEVPTSLK